MLFHLNEHVKGIRLCLILFFFSSFAGFEQRKFLLDDLITNLQETKRDQSYTGGEIKSMEV